MLWGLKRRGWVRRSLVRGRRETMRQMLRMLRNHRLIPLMLGVPVGGRRSPMWIGLRQRTHVMQHSVF
jgi:hypothetical protein